MPLDRQPNPLDGLRNMVFRGPTPFTNTVLFINVVLLVLGYVANNVATPLMAEHLAATPENALRHPWSLVLYPLFPQGPIGLLCWGFTLWQFGGSLERSWGAARYAIFFTAITLVSSLSVVLGDVVLHQQIPLISFLLPLAGIMIAFCALNPNSPINCIFVSIPTQWVMAIVFALVWFFMGNPLLGLFAEAGPLAALWYIKNGRSWGDVGHYTKPRSRGDIIDLQAARKHKSNAVYLDGSLRRSPFDIAGKLRDVQERKRLERLLRNSGLSDPDERRDERR
jgi:membrane associated rhomboid family serine protease